jgi:hypothetical protein
VISQPPFRRLRERLSVLDGKRVEKTLLPSIRTNPVVEIVEVSSGCLSSCTFCQTKLARGSLFSYRPATVRERVKRAVEEGVKEIWLTSQDMSAYGRDIGTNLAELLKGITSYAAGDYRIAWPVGHCSKNSSYSERRKQKQTINLTMWLACHSCHFQDTGQSPLSTSVRRYATLDRPAHMRMPMHRRNCSACTVDSVERATGPR